MSPVRPVVSADHSFAFRERLSCRLQRRKSINAVTVKGQRRMREEYGERETVSRATQRVLRSFIDWGY